MEELGEARPGAAGRRREGGALSPPKAKSEEWSAEFVGGGLHSSAPLSRQRGPSPALSPFSHTHVHHGRRRPLRPVARPARAAARLSGRLHGGEGEGEREKDLRANVSWSQLRVKLCVSAVPVRGRRERRTPGAAAAAVCPRPPPMENKTLQLSPPPLPQAAATSLFETCVDVLERLPVREWEGRSGLMFGESHDPLSPFDDVPSAPSCRTPRQNLRPPPADPPPFPPLPPRS